MISAECAALDDAQSRWTLSIAHEHCALLLKPWRLEQRPDFGLGASEHHQRPCRR